jgi:hypothetical protein
MGQNPHSKAFIPVSLQTRPWRRLFVDWRANFEIRAHFSRRVERLIDCIINQSSRRGKFYTVFTSDWPYNGLRVLRF